ncbi:MAG: DUF2608 domain-containing protein [Parachlamydiaceae bacterium]|nr:DUF2608 domain-containing protein [Parachlamydiaceae bacterium]
MKIQKIFFFWFVSFFCFSAPLSLFSKIIEICDIQVLAPFINESNKEDNVLILFDIDDTLIDSPISLNSGPWISYYWKNVPKLLPDKMPIIEELMWHVSKSIPILPVDSTSASLISDCQKISSMIPLAFTARPIYKKQIDGIQVTENQLLNININFRLTALPPSLSKHPALHAGVIFTSGKMKGDFLKKFLSSTGYVPKQVIVIDDKLDQIESIEKSMEEAGIKVNCFWYRRASMIRPIFNLQIANVQLEYLLKHQLILSDEEAAGLLIAYEDRSPEEFLKQLIEFYGKTYFK